MARTTKNAPRQRGNGHRPGAVSVLTHDTPETGPRQELIAQAERHAHAAWVAWQDAKRAGDLDAAEKWRRRQLQHQRIILELRGGGGDD